MNQKLKTSVLNRLGKTNKERARLMASCYRELAATFKRAKVPHIVPVPEIRNAFMEMGISRGDTVLIHSATGTLSRAGSEPFMGEFSPVEYSKDILEMLFDLIGAEGTVLAPTAPVTPGYTAALQGKVFDYRKAKAGTGLVPNLLRSREGAVRSLYPWQNVTACGAKAAWLMEGHEKATPYAMSKDSPWYKLNEIGGKVILLGVTHDRSSTVHVVEYNHPDEYPRPVYYNKPHRFSYIDRNGGQADVEMFLHAVTWQDQDINNFCNYVDEQHHIYTTLPLHNTTVTCFEAKKQYEAFYAEMKRDNCMYDSRFWAARRR